MFSICRIDQREPQVMAYTIEDARFDVVQLGKCPICFRYPSEGCKHCPECGKVECKVDHG